MDAMTRAQAEEFARGWIADWNARNIDAVLARYAEDCEFVSSRASAFVHAPTLVGKAALRSYFERALVDVPSLHFELDHVIWDPVAAALVMVHVAVIDAKRIRECEVMYFDAAGHVRRDEAFYGGAS
jgi:hypothetical protein